MFKVNKESILDYLLLNVCNHICIKGQQLHSISTLTDIMMSILMAKDLLTILFHKHSLNVRESHPHISIEMDNLITSSNLNRLDKLSASTR